MSDEKASQPRYLGRKLISIGFVLTGLVLAGTAIFMVWTFGEGLGATHDQQLAYAVAHVALHVFGMLVAFSIGIFIVDKSRWLAALSILIALGVGSYGISNIIGFSAKNRLSVSDAVRENDRRAMLRYEAAKEDLRQKRDWAGGMSVSFEKNRYERLTYKKQEREYQKMLDDLKMPQVTASTVKGDAGASVFARLFNSSDEDWEVRFAVLIGVLMFVGEFFSFILSGKMWPTELTVPSLAVRKPWSSSEGSGGDFPDNVTPIKRPESAPMQAHTHGDSETDKVSNAGTSVSASAPPQRPVNNQGQRAYPRKKFSEEEAQSDLHRILDATRTQPSQETLADIWGVSQATVSRWLTKWDGVRTKGLSRIFTKNMHGKGGYRGLQSVL